MSWETHLAAATIGVAMAIALRRLDVPPRKRYTWEEEDNEDDDEDVEIAEASESDEGNSRPALDEPDRG
jgi:hypothetical protein